MTRHNRRALSPTESRSGSANADEVDDEDERLAGQPVATTSRAKPRVIASSDSPSKKPQVWDVSQSGGCAWWVLIFGMPLMVVVQATRCSIQSAVNSKAIDMQRLNSCKRWPCPSQCRRAEPTSA